MAVTVDVSGVDEAKAAAKAARKAINVVLKAQHKESAEVVADDARTRVPVRTGRLRKSIAAQGTTTVGQVKAGTASINYARAIHFGFAKRPNKARGIRGGPIKPRPFLYAALDKRGPEIVAKWGKAVDRWVENFEKDMAG